MDLYLKVMFHVSHGTDVVGRLLNVFYGRQRSSISFRGENSRHLSRIRCHENHEKDAPKELQKFAAWGLYTWRSQGNFFSTSRENDEASIGDETNFHVEAFENFGGLLVSFNDSGQI